MFMVLYSDGRSVNANTEKWRVKDIVIPDINTSVDKGTPSGVHGSTSYSINIGNRDTISVVFDVYLQQMDYATYREAERHIYKSFNMGAGKLYAIVNGDKSEYYINVIKKDIKISKQGRHKLTVEVEFDNVGLPYFISDDYQVSTYANQSIIAHDNLSDTILDPRFMDITYIISIKENTSFFEISVNDVKWRITKSMKAGDTIVFSKAATTINGTDVSHETNMTVPVLNAGANEISILGTMNYEIQIMNKKYQY